MYNLGEKVLKKQRICQRDRNDIAKYIPRKCVSDNIRTSPPIKRLKVPSNSNSNSKSKSKSKIPQEIKIHKPGVLPHHEPIDMILLLHVKNFNTLCNLYLAYKQRFNKLLNDPYILNQLATNFKLRGYFKNFFDFATRYKGIPPKFEVGIINYDPLAAKIPSESQWQIDRKKEWLGKLITIQSSTRVYFDAFSLTYTSSDDSISWNGDLYKVVNENLYVPNFKLFTFIDKLYNKLNSTEKYSALMCL